MQVVHQLELSCQSPLEFFFAANPPFSSLRPFFFAHFPPL